VDATENDRLTEVGPGTPGGELLRHYWQPAALVEELDGDRPLVPVRLLGEDLVLFRDDDGQCGLIARACAHRRVDLSFGRLEDGGLRCPFHGWLFDRTGACLETPAEPEGSTFCTRVRQPAYPVIERNGIVWAWMGDGPPPPLPGFDALVAPEAQVFAFKGRWDCNWLQAHEVGIDPAHASFLHRFLGELDEEYGLQFRATVGDTGVPTTVLMREVPNPDITIEPTDYGFRLVTLRNYRGEADNRDDQHRFTHVRITNCIFPNAITIPLSQTMVITQWHVPIDDTACYWYSMFVSYDEPVDAAQMRAQRIDAVDLPGYSPRTGRHNDWGYDPDEQATLTYTGMGMDINVHDQWAVESPGPIHDRTREHLSPSDVGIRAQRRMMIAAMDRPSPETLIGTADPAALRGPGAIDAVAEPGTGDGVAPGRLDAVWRAQEAKRRAAAPWAPELEPDGDQPADRSGPEGG
jgi:phenylpropionate dioxygenase-like ring-hydroxylating dioxygenase large terminal subunit